MASIINFSPSIPILDSYDELHITIDKGAVVIGYLFCAIFSFVLGILAFGLFIWLY